jgi:hypothetical protein
MFVYDELGNEAACWRSYLSTLKAALVDVVASHLGRELSDDEFTELINTVPVQNVERSLDEWISAMLIMPDAIRLETREELGSCYPGNEFRSMYEIVSAARRTEDGSDEEPSGPLTLRLYRREVFDQ